MQSTASSRNKARNQPSKRPVRDEFSSVESLIKHRSKPLSLVNAIHKTGGCLVPGMDGQWGIFPILVDDLYSSLHYKGHINCKDGGATLYAYIHLQIINRIPMYI